MQLTGLSNTGEGKSACISPIEIDTEILRKEKIKLILTSYFGNRKLKSNGLIPVAISLDVPNNFLGKRCLVLTPTRYMTDLLLAKNIETFLQLYTTEILAWLDPVKVYTNLDGSVLLSTEKSKTYSHRRLIAEWLEKGTGNKVNEL